MLEGLDRIAWDELEDAYGPAGRVPGYIRLLASAGPEERKQGRDALWNTIAHQGTRYQAAPPAVPFLLELLADSAKPDRDALIHLLVYLAAGYHENHLPLGFDPGTAYAAADEAAVAAGEADWDVQDATWGRKTYEAVLQGAGLLRQLTADPDPGVRIAAVRALAWLPDAASESLPVVRMVARQAGITTTASRPAVETAGYPGPKSACADSSPDATAETPGAPPRTSAAARRPFSRDLDEAANALFCLGILARGRGDTSDATWLREQLAPERPYGVRVAAAISLAVMLGKALPGEALSVLLEAVRDVERGLEEGARISWHINGLIAHVADTLHSLALEPAEPVLAALCRAAETVPPMASLDVMAALLPLVFPQPDAAEDELMKPAGSGLRLRKSALLTPEQRRALQAISRSPMWPWKGQGFDAHSELLCCYYLPTSQEALTEYLEGRLV